MNTITSIIIATISTSLGIAAAWFFSYFYYKKSMQKQTNEAQKEIKELISELEKQNKIESHELFLQKVLEECIEEYRKRGTPVRVLDSYDKLTTEEKAGLYDKTMLRVKGRLGKSNKYKQ